MKPDSKRDIDAVIATLKYAGYKIPPWCTLHPFCHADGMGGCWGIGSGRVSGKGEAYCKECEYYRSASGRP